MSKIVKSLAYFLCLSFMLSVINAFSQADKTLETLCGTYESTNKNGLISKLEILSWNELQMHTPFDGIMDDFTKENKPVRPSSRYFISGDTLYLESDKGYLLFDARKKHKLKGIGFWVKKDRLKLKKESAANCPNTYSPNKEDLSWLKHSKTYYKIYHSRENQELMLTRAEKLCAEGFGPACLTQATYLIIKDKKAGIALLEKACEMGYFGNYACYRLGEVQNTFGNTAAAKIAYQKACEGGHAVGCMALSFLNTDEN